MSDELNIYPNEDPALAYAKLVKAETEVQQAMAEVVGLHRSLARTTLLNHLISAKAIIVMERALAELGVDNSILSQQPTPSTDEVTP